MRIMNQKVEHKRYGIGTIFALKGKKVYVAFGKLYGDMAFPYPKVFEGDMKLVNQELQEELKRYQSDDIYVSGSKGMHTTKCQLLLERGFREAESGPDMSYVGDNAFGKPLFACKNFLFKKY